MANMILFTNNRFGPAEQGTQSCFAAVLGLIVYILVGLTHDLLPIFFTCHGEELPMKTKATRVLLAASKSTLNSVWTVGPNLLAGALLA